MRKNRAVQGTRVMGFTHDEEETAGLSTVIPFLVEDALKQAGSQFECTASGHEYAIADGILVAGQKTASSAAAARKSLMLLT